MGTMKEFSEKEIYEMMKKMQSLIVVPHRPNFSVNEEHRDLKKSEENESL